MIIILSPSKTIDTETKAISMEWSVPLLTHKAVHLAEILKHFSVDQLMALMKINRKLAILNHQRIQMWQPEPINGYSEKAVCAFKGEVYHGLDVDTWKVDDFLFAQQHLVILSGLYGVLRPLDLINAYRLEMGTKFPKQLGMDLYKFWGETINETINSMVSRQKEKVLINLASNEYYKAILPKKINHTVITPVFMDFKDGRYQVITIYAKKARGSMARFIVQNRIESPDVIKAFDIDGYLFNARLSDEKTWVFCRD